MSLEERCAIYEQNVEAESNIDTTAMAQADVEHEYQKIARHRVRKLLGVLVSSAVSPRIGVGRHGQEKAMISPTHDHKIDSF